MEEFKINIMDNNLQKKKTAMNLALRYAKEILADAGISMVDDFYSLRVYEMQFNIYQELKLVMNIDDE